MRYVVNSPPRQETTEMAEDTETVDEAEALIQQLLDAGMVERLQNSPQVGDETVDEEDDDADTETDTEDAFLSPGDEEVRTGEPTEPTGTPATPPTLAETPGPFDSLASGDDAGLLSVIVLLT